MRSRAVVGIIASFVTLTSPARAYNLSLELISDTELTIGQAFWYDLQGWNPVGEPLLVWGLLSNNEDELVQLTGVGQFSPDFSTSGGWYFVYHYAMEFFDPDLDPSDPFIRNSYGDYAIELEPGESVDFPFVRIWGMSYDNYPTFAIPVGTTIQLDGGTIAYWEFDRSPNNVFHGPPTVFIELDRGFSVTVVPEPSSIALFLGCALIILCTRTKRTSVVNPARSD